MLSDIEELNIPLLIKDAIEKHGASQDAIIPILTEINTNLGYIPAEVFPELRQQLHNSENRIVVSESQLYSLATFYSMLSVNPRGRHVLKFCESAPCHVVGGKEVWQAICAELKLKSGETSPDGKWTLETTSCIGICSVGPVILVDDEIIGNVKPEQVPEILSRYE